MSLTSASGRNTATVVTVDAVIAPATSFTKAPKGWNAAEAATITCAGVTAWRGLVGDGALKGGETVLVQGTGGVSIYGLQIAKAFGCTVIATSSSDEKLERLKALGADHLINYKSTPEWGKAALKLTGGRGAEAVIDFVGEGDTIAKGLAMTANGGVYYIVGYGGKIELPTLDMITTEKSIVGNLVGTYAELVELMALADRGSVNLHTKEYKLSHANDALHDLHHGKVHGRAVLVP